MGIDPLGPAEAGRPGLPPTTAKTGFASQPSEHQEIPLNLHDLIVTSPQTTFFFRAAGPAPAHTPIFAGDVLVIDKAAPLKDGVLVVALDGEAFLVCRLRRQGQQWLLASETPGVPPMLITDPAQVFGRITHVVHPVPLFQAESVKPEGDSA